MLASGVPGSLAARRVSTSRREVRRSPVVYPIKLTAKDAEVLTVTCNAPTRIAAGRGIVQKAERGRGESRGERGGMGLGARDGAGQKLAEKPFRPARRPAPRVLARIGGRLTLGMWYPYNEVYKEAA